MKLYIPKEEDYFKSYSKELEEYIERLEHENERIYTKLDDSDKKIERLNNIINKAIEYLESYNTDFKNCRFGEAPISIRELGDLLDILKGSGKE